MDIKITLFHRELDKVILWINQRALYPDMSTKFASSSSPFVDWSNRLYNGIFDFI